MVAALDHLTDGVLVLDAEWHFRYVNEPAAEMLGPTREELIGAHAWTMFPEAVGGKSYLALHQARKKRRRLRVTELHEPLDRTFETRIYPVGADLVVLFRDVTDSEPI